MRHDLTEIELALDYVSGQPSMMNAAFLCRETGRVF